MTRFLSFLTKVLTWPPLVELLDVVELYQENQVLADH